MAEAIVRHFNGDWNGRQGAIAAPGHSVKDRGVTVRDGDNGEVIFHSFNGGDWRSIKDECRRLGLLPERESRSDNDRGGWRETGVFEYAGADGAVAYRTVRKERHGEAKRFVAQRPDGKGGWTNGIAGLGRVLYRLPEILAADPATPVYLVEGERKADKLASWGLVATAVAFGAKGWQSAYAAPLAGRRVIILPDNDQVGRGFAERAAESLRGVGATVIVLELPGLPDKGDIIDWHGTADELAAQVAGAGARTAAARRRLPTIDIAAWLNLDPPKREFYVGDLVPARQTTLLTGNGGVGKSLLAQQLCTCVALGLPFMGQAVKQSPALYLTVEDDADELWRRQAAICAGLGAPLSAVIGKLHLVSLMGEPGAELAMFDENKRVLPTDRWREVDDTSLHDGIAFIVLDNATDLMAGDLNEVHEVAAFVNLLTGLALRRDGAVILLHHPNKKGDDFAGSQAWHNKVRSRLIMTRDDTDLDARKLTNPKANYAAVGGELSFRWIDGAFLTEHDIGPDRHRQYEESARAGADNAIFLACLAERNKQERAVSECPGPNYAPAQFEAMPESKGIGKKRLVAAMDRLYRVGRIKRAFLRRDSAKARDIEGLCEVASTPPPNAPPNAPQTLSQNAPIMAPEPPQPHTPPLQGGTGAALAAAPYPGEQRKPARTTGMILAPGEDGDHVDL